MFIFLVGVAKSLALTVSLTWDSRENARLEPAKTILLSVQMSPLHVSYSVTPLSFWKAFFGLQFFFYIIFDLLKKNIKVTNFVCVMLSNSVSLNDQFFGRVGWFSLLLFFHKNRGWFHLLAWIRIPNIRKSWYFLPKF